ncbi:MAG: hypothetical protein ACN4GF_01960 [Lentimonas sp.]
MLALNQKALEGSKRTLKQVTVRYECTLSRQRGMTLVFIRDGASFRYTLARGRLLTALGYKPKNNENKRVDECFTKPPGFLQLNKRITNEHGPEAFVSKRLSP